MSRRFSGEDQVRVLTFGVAGRWLRRVQRLDLLAGVASA
jgi:hypothetical protein